MGFLQGDERDRLLKMLRKLPSIEDSAVRRILLAGLPSGLTQSIAFTNVTLADLNAILDIADGEAWAQLSDRSWSIVRVIENAISMVIGALLEVELQALQRELRERVMAQEESTQFQQALLAAFPSRNDIESLVVAKFGQKLETISASADPPQLIVDIITWAERRGRVDLLGAAIAINPRNQQLSALAGQFGLTPTAAGGVAFGLESDPAPFSQPKGLQPPSTPAFLDQLTQALVDAFDRTDLRLLAWDQLKVDLDHAIGGASFQEVARNLVVWAEQRGEIIALLQGALRRQPRDPHIQALARQAGIPALEPPSSGLEQLAQSAPGLMARLSVATQAVCRIERDNGSLGTGFLVGSDLVLTCDYMIQGMTSARLRFGYEVTPEGQLKAGQEYTLAEDWLVDRSPVEELDYALIRVAGRPGDDPVDGRAGAPPRRWLVPAAGHTFQVNEPLLSIQHPEGKPLTLEIGSIEEVRDNESRLIYALNTQPGSGGAPCFDADCNLIALHEASTAAGSTLKQGILISAIVAQPKVRAALGI